MKSKKFVVDLFAGCGGLSLGLEKAGFHPVYVNELNKDAMASYLVNRKILAPKLGNPEFHGYDIKDIVTQKGSIKRLKASLKREFNISIANGDLDLVVGGPPCQGFSGIGHRRSYSVDKKQLPSNHLYQDMAWVVNELKPKIFMFENVKGLMSARWTSAGIKGEIFEDVLHSFSSLKGYQINHSLVVSKDYGVPQNRPRILVVGVRNDIDTSPWKKSKDMIANGFLPDPTYQAPDPIDLLGDLVDPNFEYGGCTSRYPEKSQNKHQRELRTNIDGTVARKGALLTEHEYSKHSKTVVERFSYMLRHNGAIPPRLRTKKFAQRLLPTHWGPNGPSITVASLADDYVHFSQARVPTVREWARLQGFPDWYQFAGSRTTGGLRRAGNPQQGMFHRELPKYTQIGNAVPVKLAEQIGLHFAKIL